MTRLPRLDHAVPIVHNNYPTVNFHISWQKVVEEVETKLTVEDDPLNWGTGSVKLPDSIPVLSIGDGQTVGTISIQLSPAPTQPGRIYMAVAGWTGAAWMGNLTANNRIAMANDGSITGFEFSDTPYVGTNKIFHKGNVLPAQVNSTAAVLADLKADFNALLAKLRAAELMAP